MWDRARQGKTGHMCMSQVRASRLHCYALDINVPVCWIRLTGVIRARFLQVVPHGSFWLEFLAIGVPVQAECVPH